MICLQKALYPLAANVYYATAVQSDYGNLTMTWRFGKKIDIALQAVGEGSFKTENKVGEFFKPELGFVLYTPANICKHDRPYAIDEILISDISNGEQVFIEGTGSHEGWPTRFSLETNKPLLDGFGRVEAYRLTIVRMQDQGVSIDENTG